MGDSIGGLERRRGWLILSECIILTQFSKTRLTVQLKKKTRLNFQKISFFLVSRHQKRESPLRSESQQMTFFIIKVPGLK